MPYDAVGINLKASHAVLFGMDSSRAPATKKCPSLPYERAGKNTQLLWTKEEYNIRFHPEKKKKITLTNKQKSLSMKSQTRIRNTINLLLECSKRKKVFSKKENKVFSYKVGFMTLTLPLDCKMSDRNIYEKIFKPFIRVLKEKYSLGEYVWKAEVQDNNQLHFHLTINVFIHWRKINEEWNKQIENTGYRFASENHTKEHLLKSTLLGQLRISQGTCVDTLRKRTPIKRKEKRSRNIRILGTQRRPIYLKISLCLAVRLEKDGLKLNCGVARKT